MSEQTHTLTLADVFDGPTYAAVKGTGIGRALESQSELLVIDPPVVEDGVDFVVDDVFLQDALQHHLTTHTVEWSDKTYQQHCVTLGRAKAAPGCIDGIKCHAQ